MDDVQITITSGDNVLGFVFKSVETLLIELSRWQQR